MTAAYNAIIEYREAARSATNRRLKQLGAETQWLVKLCRDKGLPLDWQNTYGGWHDSISELGALRFMSTDTSADQCVQDLERVCPVESSDLRRFIRTDTHTFLNQINDLDDNSFVITEDGFIAIRDNSFFCEADENYWVDDDDFKTVTVSGRSSGTWNTQRWSEPAADNSAFYCNAGDRFFASSEFSETVDSNDDTVCNEYCASSNSYQWSDRCDCWVHDDNWDSDTHSYDDEEDEDDGEDDEDNGVIPARGTSLPGYHSAPRRWSYTLANQSSRSFFGLEIELDYQTFENRELFFREYIIPNSGGYKQFSAEIDGSLSRTTGMEIITRPYALQELRTEGNPVHQLLSAAKAIGAHVPNHNHGIHITTNWGRLNDNHRDRLSRLLLNCRLLTIYISRRKENENYAAFASSGGKHTAVAPRSVDAVEIRTFLSTTDYEVLMSYVEYIEAAIQWTTDDRNVLRGAMAQAAFRQWFTTCGQFPYLASRFNKLLNKDRAECASPSSNLLTSNYPVNVSNIASVTTLTAPDTGISARIPDAPQVTLTSWDAMVASSISASTLRALA